MLHLNTDVNLLLLLLLLLLMPLMSLLLLITYLQSAKKPYSLSIPTIILSHSTKTQHKTPKFIMKLLQKDSHHLVIPFLFAFNSFSSVIQFH